MKLRIIAASMLILILFAGCKTTDPIDPIICMKCTWVAIDPIQCMGNPWEQEWLEQHPGELYPMELEDKLPIVVDYYQRHGCRIFDSRIIMTYNEVCRACSCPAGYTVYFHVLNRDVPGMLDLGFRIESPE